MMEDISGSVEIWNIFAPGADGETFPEGVFTATVRSPKGASAAIDISCDTELPSAATMGEPFIVIPVDGERLTPVTPPKLAPLIVSIMLVAPGEPALGSIPVIADPKATPTDGARIGLIVTGVDGGAIFSSSTPTPGDITGLKVFEIAGGGGVWIITPTIDDKRGVNVVPGDDVIVKLFATEAISVVVPPPVVMVTTRWPVGALEVIETLTVARVPSALTDGGLPIDTPVSGIKFTDVAPVRSLPFTVNVRLVPIAPEIGMIEAISGGGKVTVKISAKGMDGLARPEDVFTATLLWVLGASCAIDIMIDTELPSAATMGEPFMVIPVFGWKETCEAPSRFAPFMVIVRLSVPIIPLFGLMDVMVGPKAIPTGSPLTGPKVLEVDAGDPSIITPTWGAIRGVKVVPGCDVTVKVFAAEARPVVVPPPVVIVTTLCPTGAPAAIDILTVARVP